MQDSGGSGILDAVRQAQAGNYFSLASAVLVYYEYLATLDDEVKFFWRRTKRGTTTPRFRINTVTALFLLNRYVPMGLYSTIIAHNLGVLSQQGFVRRGDLVHSVLYDFDLIFRILSCKNIHILDRIGTVATQVIVGLVTAIRIYAIYERSRAVWTVLLGFFVCALTVALWSVLGKSPDHQTVILPAKFGCHTPLSREGGNHTAAPWIVLMVYDAVVFSLMLWKALQIWKLGSSRLFHILIRDGSIFFLVMTMANLVNILALMLAQPFLKDMCTAFTSAMSVTMVSRLMINIQNPRSFEEPGTGRHIATTDVETLVTVVDDEDSGFTRNDWTFEGR